METKSIERLGGNQLIPLDVRLVCATNRDLQAEVKAGRFREDLLYRLNVVEIHTPSLRERPSDIGLLLYYYFQYFAKENGLLPPVLMEKVKSILQNYIWPGNIRELRNFSENMVVMHSGKKIEVTDLDPKFLAPIGHDALPHTLEKNEQKLISETLKNVNGNKSEAARLLGIPRRTFYRKLEKFQETDRL